VETEIIVALITGIFAVIAAIITGILPHLLEKKSRLKSKISTSNGESTGKFRRFIILVNKYYSILVIGLLVIGLLLIGIAIYSIYTQPTDVDIRFPGNGKVDMWEWVSGTSQHIPDDCKLWIVVRWDSLYFPMVDGVQTRSDGTWMYNTSIGQKDDAGKVFEIIAVLADGSAQAKVEEWYKSSSDLYHLPSGMTQYSTVTVTRK
jgi:hypothetical protein